jgi:uncharacterized phage-like protein YoqJ
MICAATGHRPQKLGGFGSSIRLKLKELARQFLETTKPEKVITGMALGWDQAWAEAAVGLAIPFIAAVPFARQESTWPEPSQRLYRDLLVQAAETVIVLPGGYAPYKMQVRNEWMVDRADCVVALWDGTSGGTANCIAYANKTGKPIINLWSQWRVAR